MRKPCLLLALAALLWASAARADRVELSVGTGPWFVKSPSMDAVAEDDVMGATDLGLAVRLVDVPVLQSIYLDVHYLLAGTTAMDFQDFESSLHLQSVHVGASAVRDLAPHLRAHARLATGVTIGDLDIAPDEWSPEPAISDRDVVPSGYAGGGLEAFWDPRHAPYLRHLDGIGLRVDVGYLEVRPLGFSARPHYPADGLARLPTAAATMGSLDASGWTGHVALVARW